MGDFWEVTAQMYGALFEKPKMSEKLLSKPPFKYIFDIISETTKTTGFAKGLLKGDELGADYYSDKDRKIEYLRKFILITSFMLGEEIEAKPNKIVAGVEPDKTNLFLQALYRAAVSGEDSAPYVSKTLKKMSSGDAEEETKTEEPKKKTQEPAKKQEPPKQESKQQDSGQQQRVRPPSASHKRAPQVKENTTVEVDKKTSGGPGSIIMENDRRDDADQFIGGGARGQSSNIHADQHGQFIREAMKQSEDQPAEQQGEGESKGGIKLKGLRSKKKDDKTPATKNEALKSIIPDSQSTTTGGGSSAPDEIEILQKIIQSVIQNTNPLKKSLDFLNDDIESMNKEMDKWRGEYLQSKEKYQIELKSTEEALQPMMDKLADIEEQVKDKKAKIQSVKSSIILNNNRIQDLLFSVVSTK